MSRYRVVLTPEPDGSAYNVTVPALPGCFTFGATVAQALARAEEAIAGHVAALAEVGAPVPAGTRGHAAVVRPRRRSPNGHGRPTTRRLAPRQQIRTVAVPDRPLVSS